MPNHTPRNRLISTAFFPTAFVLLRLAVDVLAGWMTVLLSPPVVVDDVATVRFEVSWPEEGFVDERFVPVCVVWAERNGTAKGSAPIGELGVQGAGTLQI